MAMLLTVANAASLTATGPTANVVTNATPYVSGRNAILRPTVPAGGGVVVIQTAGRNDTGFTNPTTVATITATNPPTPEGIEITLDGLIRANVTTAGTGTFTAVLEGVQ